MRLIDADALRKNAQHAKDISKWDGELLVVGLGHILSAPTIESPRHDWTPCAEGLPTLNDDGSYREVRATYKTWGGTLTVTDAVYMPEYDEWFEITHDGQFYLENVIAWKPQDIPYRADDTTGEED